MKRINRHTRFVSRLLMAFCIMAGAGLLLLSFRAGASNAGVQSHAARVDGVDSLLQSPLYLTNGSAADRSGYSVALSGNTALVGSLGHRVAADAAPGAVSVFQRTGLMWSLQAKLASGEAQVSNATFATSVAIEGDTAVVGAPRYLGGNTGAVYVYRRDGTTWTRTAKITNAGQNYFGTSVAISDDTIVVGDPFSPMTGTATVYRFNGSVWQEEAVINNPLPSPGDQFATSVAISGDTIAVGAFADNTILTGDSGAVFVFKRNGTTWSQQAEIIASDPGNADYFGYSVAIKGDTLVVGAYRGDTPTLDDTGVVYVYQRNGTTWTELPKLVASDAKVDDRLGFSVAISGNTIVSGASYYDLPSRQNTGASYVFQRSNNQWLQTSMDFTAEGAPGDLFGNSVAVSDNTLITGVPNFDKPEAQNIGIAYAYTLRPTLRNTGDFDGDAKVDLSVFRPADGTWYVRQSTDAASFIKQFGASGDRPVPGDYDGDGKTDVAVFRPSNSTWYILYSSNNVVRGQQFGANGDLPVPGDYDGNGVTDPAVFRPSDGTWYMQVGGFFTVVRAQQFGANGDRPVQGDYDGDGKTDFALLRPSNNTWYILNSSNNSLRFQPWGVAGDVAVPADFDGDVRTDVAVFRPTDGTWYILQSSLSGFRGQSWGTSGDIPAPGDYNGDGKADIAVFRPTDGNWYILQSGLNNLRVEQWGASGDVPLPTAHLP